jgi:hypothetical protein
VAFLRSCGCLCALKSSSTDVNGDGVAESIHVEVTTPLSTDETIRQATVMVVLNYSLKVHSLGNVGCGLTCCNFLIRRFVDGFRATRSSAWTS